MKVYQIKNSDFVKCEDTVLSGYFYNNLLEYLSRFSGDDFYKKGGVRYVLFERIETDRKVYENIFVPVVDFFTNINEYIFNMYSESDLWLEIVGKIFKDFEGGSVIELKPLFLSCYVFFDKEYFFNNILYFPNLVMKVEKDYFSPKKEKDILFTLKYFSGEEVILSLPDKIFEYIFDVRKYLYF